jgi:hypothetical protein
LDPASVAGADIFNPNDWVGASKGVVQSCWSEYSALAYCVDRLTDICARANELCAKHVAIIQDQWSRSHFSPNTVDIYGELPELHIQVEAFFSSVKSLLDLLVQLLSTEGVVGAQVHGFHAEKNVYGGKVLGILKNNARKKHAERAEHIFELICKHKTEWIDRVVEARDLLVHPQLGAHQLMFRLDFAQDGKTLVFNRARSPIVNDAEVDVFAKDVVQHTRGFSAEFLAAVADGT